ncbi:MAG: fumarylacetoacetate hydrolase family protein [Caulobacteraceae bacterium]|nr:fumarylacetoacetate hydrolase family protein [Caulobacteraceae bacterium]
MPDYVFPPAAVPAVPVEGTTALFPVRRILCVGRNYAAHRREMGGDEREPPFFFAKPADAIVPLGGDVPYPSLTANLHHEVELVAALGGGGADVPVEDALSLVFGYAVGVDLTRRDLQSAAKDKGQPWEAGKGFDAGAPIGAIRPAALCGEATGAISLTVNGQTRQAARVADMIWSTAEVIAQASRLWRLAPGDLIFTGTPEGVGPLVRGDVVHGEIESVGVLDFTIR